MKLRECRELIVDVIRKSGLDWQDGSQRATIAKIVVQRRPDLYDVLPDGLTPPPRPSSVMFTAGEQ